MVKIISPIEIQAKPLIEEELLLADMLKIEQLAKSTEYYKREPKKITATYIFTSFLLIKNLGSNSLKSWAAQLGRLANETISKEALNERLNEQAVQLFKTILKHALSIKIDTKKVQGSKGNVSKFIKHFNRILMRDSTIQQINSIFRNHYSGNHSKGDPTSLIRIQALYNFSSEQWVDLDLNGYANNDQSAACDIADYMQEKDLLLQDLGYFVLEWLEQVVENKYIISRWDNKTNLYTVDDEKIDLLELLKKKENKRRVDMDILVGREKKIPMRLVIKKLKPKIAKARIKKARKDRHSKSNHSEQYYKLLNYEIYLTNVEANVLDVVGIAKLYGLRWHIEILFKGWKSFDHFKEILKGRKMKIERLRISIYMLLIKIVWVKNVVYKYVKDRGKYDRPISDLKFIDLVNICLDYILKISSLDQLDVLLPQFKQHALYDKHTKRRNTKDKYNTFSYLHIT